MTRPSGAHLCLYLGLKATASELGLPKYNFGSIPDADIDRMFAEGLESPESACRAAYISFPAAKDPDFENRCPGRTTIDVIGFVSYDAFARWEESQWKKRPADYEALKERLSAKLLDILYKYVPQVRGKIDVYELSTPLTTRHFANQPHGEIYGIDHTPSRFRQRWLRPQTPIPGLFLTGQDIASCGVAARLIGGVLTASAILRKNLIATIIKSGRERATSMVESAEDKAGARGTSVASASASSSRDGR